MSLEEKQLDALFAVAVRASEGGESATDFEPAFSALLDYIRLHPDIHPRALDTLVEGVRNNSLGWELVSFLMHDLRWPEVREITLQVIQRAVDWRIKTPMSHILEAYDDEWDEADIYHRYRKQ